MEDLTGKQLGPYQVVAPLGEGGMAAVYKAYQPGMDRYVALKILPRKLAEDPQFVGRFKQEAKVLAKLQHPHILPVFDFGEADGYTYIVMPFVESGTLADLLRGQPLPLKQIRSIVSQVGGALHYAHTHGLVHRDVKPSNVLVDESGNCLLTDFGIAKMVEGTAKFTGTGGVIGTPAYMSPEQGRGEKLDGRSDIYSLGIMLFEMATGRVPFNAETPVAIIFKHISDPLPMPRATNPALPESVERVILKALAKNPEERFQKAEEMVEALTVESRVLGQYSGTSKTLIETMPSGEAAKKPRRAFPVWAWVMAVVGLVVVVGMMGIAGWVFVIPLLAVPATEVGSNSQIISTSATAETQAVLAITPSKTPKPTRTPAPTATAIPAGTILFEEDFEDGKAQQFRNWEGGIWEVVTDDTGNKTYSIDYREGSGFPRMIFGSTAWGNYAVQFRVRIIASVGSDAIAGINFRESERLAGYQLQLQPYSKKVVLGYWSGSGWQDIREKSLNIERGVWYSVRVEASGTRIQVAIDDSLMIDVTDYSSARGALSFQVGTGMYADFDDIRVTTLGK